MIMIKKPNVKSTPKWKTVGIFEYSPSHQTCNSLPLSNNIISEKYLSNINSSQFIDTVNIINAMPWSELDNNIQVMNITPKHFM